MACGLQLVACSLQLVVCGLWLAIGTLEWGPTIFVENRQKHQHKVGNFLNNFKTPIYTRPKMDPRHTTLREIGLRTEKSIALHLLQANTYESNLVSDIANAPYLRGNAGRTHLAPIPGFPPFVDDIYLYGRLQERDIVRVGNRVSCTTGEHGSAARIVSQISLFVREVWPPGEHKHIHVSIANTVAVGSGTRIPQTIQGIEERDEGRLASTWQSIHGGKRAAAFFVAKMDVSELPTATLHAGLPKLQRLLVANGMSLYQVDYTQDFSGTLDRKALVQHLEEVHRFAYQGQVPPQNPQGCILDNTSSVGNHVCTFVSSTGTRAFSTKLYNKFVAQIEAGDVRGTFGGHMSGTVASTNQHLRQTLAHPDVLARGCTRLEISIYGCLVEELDAAKAEAMLERALQMATPEGEGSDTGLFVAQPLAKLWENYASCLDRCFVLADRPQGAIYVDWSGNSQTGRLQGVLVRPQKAQVERDVSWRRAIDWSMSDFALRGCPIFLAEILAVDGEDVVFAPLRCNTKDAPTILCASTRPCELHTNGPNLQELLPPTRVVEWAWRTRKTHRIGVEPPSCDLLEVPEMAEARNLSTLSTKGRVARLLELAEGNQRIVRTRHVRELARQEEAREARCRAEFEQLEKAASRAIQERDRRSQLHQTIDDSFAKTRLAGKIAEFAGSRVFVLAYTETNNGTKKVLLEGETDGQKRLVWVWSTRGLDRILASQESFFEKKPRIRPWCSLSWIPYRPAKNRPGLRIEVLPSKSFWTDDGRQIHWNPLELLSIPSEKGLASLRELLQSQETKDLLAQKKAKRKELVECNPVVLQRGWLPAKQKDCTAALDMAEGFYAVLLFAETRYRGVNRTILHLAPMDEKGRPNLFEQTPVRGLLLQAEIDNFRPLEELLGRRLVCHLGAPKTTKTKKPCRRAQLVLADEGSDT